MAERRASENVQPTARGDVSYRINRAGEIQKAKAGSRTVNTAQRVEVVGRYISVEILPDGEPNIRVGAIALIDGERRINREFRVNDAAQMKAVAAVLQELLDGTGDLAEARVVEDAYETLRDERVDEDEEDDA
jgi:hypothetical protein